MFSQYPYIVHKSFFYFSKSSGATIVKYDRTNSGAGSNNEYVQFSTTTGHTVGSTLLAYAEYTAERNIKFGLKATLGPGMPSIGSMLGHF